MSLFLFDAPGALVRLFGGLGLWGCLARLSRHRHHLRAFSFLKFIRLAGGLGLLGGAPGKNTGGALQLREGHRQLVPSKSALRCFEMRRRGWMPF